MKSGQAVVLSSIVIELGKASGETGFDLVTEMAHSIASKGVVPLDWAVSSIVNSYKENGEASEC